MPNGRSGGFPIERDALRRLLDGLAPNLQVGRLLDESRTLPWITAAQLGSLVETRGAPVMAVEEQDHSSYIIHVQNSPDSVWVAVPGTSPLFPPLRLQHERWLAEHPHDRGWFAF
jgi:hypothetical protein